MIRIVRTVGDKKLSGEPHIGDLFAGLRSLANSSSRSPLAWYRMQFWALSVKFSLSGPPFSLSWPCWFYLGVSVPSAGARKVIQWILGISLERLFAIGSAVSAQLTLGLGISSSPNSPLGSCDRSLEEGQRPGVRSVDSRSIHYTVIGSFSSTSDGENGLLRKSPSPGIDVL